MMNNDSICKTINYCISNVNKTILLECTLALLMYLGMHARPRQSTHSLQNTTINYEQLRKDWPHVQGFMNTFRTLEILYMI